MSLEKVCFSYNVSRLNSSTRWVLYNTSLTINAGETVALVGRSGSGKTTIFNLISKLYQPFSGKVMLDDIDIRELDIDSLRGPMSVVTQSPYIFHMSIRDNLKLAKPDMTDEEMKSVARQACIDEDIEAMPEGYDTIVGEGGVNLSGGQRRRLAIARGLLHDSKILLLDEATSALDNITQAKIRETLQRIHGKCTVIMIAHRLSTVIGADRILYIKDGSIIADGRHQELIESCPEYRELYETEVSI
ncbi:MAG: ATP-binding cassette domain-containing protein [Lachnospiraceae bacterium]|nr:ATP-binding cassette domain-containing protein [Lachnospiraceae bacterium]